MLIDWLIYGLLVFGVAKLLNATLFKLSPASRLAAWGLTIVMFFVSIAALTALKFLRLQVISDSVGVPIKPQNPLDMGGAFILSWLFFSFIKRKKKNKQPPSPLSHHNDRIVLNTDNQPVVAEDAHLALYKLAADELNANSGARNEALWYKAFADASGDERATKASYIRLRVEQLRRADVASASTSTDTVPSNTQAAQTVASFSTPINFWILGIVAFLVIGIVAAIAVSADNDMKKRQKIVQPSITIRQNSSLDVSESESFLKQQNAIPKEPLNRNTRIDFDFAGARKAGASDAKIVDYLRKRYANSFDFDSALRAGASPTQIVEYLSQ